jgi:hypothetical protein
MKKIPDPLPLTALPLWRLLVALADAERAMGPDADLTKKLAEAVQQRLGETNEQAADRALRTKRRRKEPAHA